MNSHRDKQLLKMQIINYLINRGQLIFKGSQQE